MNICGMSTRAYEKRDRTFDLPDSAHADPAQRLGDLEYGYDADGRVTQKTDTFAQSELPSAVAGNTFNAANEMTLFNGTSQTYDANGNLANDGTNTYNWDARNHLVGITGSNTSSFVYDALGRRALKTINGVSTQFLYDGSNPVQDIQNGSPSANLITGLGIDEYFQRTDSAGARDYLSDILGSSLALTDSTGTIQTQYWYDPFGDTGTSGQAMRTRTNSPEGRTTVQDSITIAPVTIIRLFRGLLHRIQLVSVVATRTSLATC